MLVLASQSATERLVTWTRLDDGWYEQPVFDDVPHDVRWHYLALIQTCSRNQRYDGTGKMCPTIRLLAAPYRDHPDFDPLWARSHDT